MLLWTSTLLELSTKIQHPSRGFKFSVSLSTLNFDFPLCELVTKEAIKNWLDKSCASFLYKLYLQWIIGKFACCIQTQFACCILKRKKLFTDLFNSAINPTGRAITSQPNINILFCWSGVARLNKRANSNKFHAKWFCPNHSCWCRLQT